MTSAAPAKKPYRKAPPQHRELRHETSALRDEQDGALTPEQCQEAWMDSEQVQLQNSYTASQRTNQDLEEKLHTLIKKAEMDKKTLDWEIVELTNKLLDAKSTIDKLEELNERYRQDCNLAVQLLKCNKSHFRNHKFADLPYELQEMVSKHLQGSTEQSSPGQDPAAGLTPSHVVPTSVIAKVLEKPESLVLNSAKSSSSSGPAPEDVFVHVDMSSGACDPAVPSESRGQASGPGAGEGQQKAHNGGFKRQNSSDPVPDEPPAFEKLSPYPLPPPPHSMYPGRKVIEFSDDKVRIPKNSPLPNCTYATRQAISLSLVQGEEEEAGERLRTLPASPASSSCSPGPSPAHGSRSQPHSSQGSPRQGPSALTSSASSEEDLLANWQRMFVDRAPPASEGVLAHRTAFSHETAQELQRSFSRSPQDADQVISTHSDSEDSGQKDGSSQADRRSHFPSEYGEDFSQDETRTLLHPQVEEEGDLQEQQRECPSEEELQERERLLEMGSSEKPAGSRPHRSPKRMGVHHLHRKDSLTRAQEQGNLLL
ncbi:tight junction-associated protein 1 isoform X2 [Rhinatrema bivittatum]|uniref:tight junction-associated protein 1 isoform X2 n=1 Tax=Rhinatrema bivittatum TaxID=194408 RepID=UPI00112717F5|nr:tight junction-associated protein 1 isoform X2 [Rhinatrema bivittatum]